MTATALKKKLHKAIDRVNDQQNLEFVQEIISGIVEEEAVQYVTSKKKNLSKKDDFISETQWKEIDRIRTKHLKGEGKWFTPDDAKNMIVGKKR